MKLSKASIPYKALKDAGGLLALFLFSGNISFSTMEPAIVFVGALVVGFIAAASLIWEYIVWSRYDYFFEEDSLRITHGVLKRNEREIPYRRIQNVNIKKNIVQRVLGIAKADFETAGGSGTEASLKYVSEEQAQSIQDRVRKFKKKEIEDKSSESSREKLFELSGQDLVAYSFLSVNARSIGLAFAGFGIMASIGAGVVNRFSIAPVLIISFLGVMFTAGLWLFSAASNFVKYYGFKLWGQQDTLEYEYGLLNRSEGSIPLEKVQGVTLEENFLKRQLDYATLRVMTAGISSQEQSMKKEVAVPLAKRKEVIEFAQKLEAFETPSIEKIPSRARKRYTGRYLIGLSGLLLAGGIASRFTEFNPLTLLILVPFTAVAAHLKWKNKGYDLQRDYFIARNGFWNRKTVVTPYYRIQNIIQTETILQKRWNLSTLTLDTAGSLGADNSRAVDIDTEKALKLREKVFENFKEALK